MSTGQSRLRVAVLFPELLGTYGDGGNGLVLQGRAQARGLDVELVSVAVGAPAPEQADLYLLGGGEDDAQTEAVARLRGSALERAVAAGAAVLAVCAGMQLAGRTFAGSDGRAHDGLALLPAVTTAGSPRLVGDLAVAADPELGLPTLIGYENHGGRTCLEGAAPLGRAVRGTGNGCAGHPGVDGALVRTGRGLVVGTYLHGPVLAQNPALADLLLTHVAGPLPEASDERLDRATRRLRGDRLASLGLAADAGW